MIKSNEYAVVCGGSYGLGLEIVKFFLNKNINTIILARNKTKLIRHKKNFNSHLLSCVSCDLSDDKQVHRVFKNFKEKKININYLICNAGNGKDDYSAKENYKNYYNAFKKNFFTAINPIENLINFKNFKKLKIIIVSSIAGHFVGGAPLSYSLAKNSLINYCEQISKNFANKDIRINSISPGHILQKNNLWYKKLKSNRIKTDRIIKHNVALKKFCTPNDVLNVINFLINKESNYITGIDIKVDGKTSR
jgi:sorbitol-6-phosphate 2-dehydrogenase